MERSKSAPKLMAIEEAIGEEDEEDAENSAGASRPSCCKEAPLFPAMTLGRKHCRRGHSIRRTKQGYNSLSRKAPPASGARVRSVSFDDHFIGNGPSRPTQNQKPNAGEEEDDEFNSLLMVNDYDTQSSLSGELLSYFDSKLSLKPAASLSELRTDSNGSGDLAEDEALDQRVTMSLDNLDQYSDEECSDRDEQSVHRSRHYYDNEADEVDTAPNTFYNQDEILDCLVNVSMQAKTECDIEANEEKILGPTALRAALKPANGAISLDSDEGSISSGCETSSNATTTNFDEFVRTEREKQRHRNERIESKLSAMANEDDCNSEVSDESGFDEIHNFLAKNMNSLNLDSLNSHVDKCESSINGNSIGINDKNNNIVPNKRDTSTPGRQFSNDSASTKEVNRLMINIPKNAKSILIWDTFRNQ